MKNVTNLLTIRSKIYQKGLSLIEASMVLVLSAIVVAGVMVYYQTAETNNQLEKTSEEVMHIVSEVNGLYAGQEPGPDWLYYNLDNTTLAAAISDIEIDKNSSQKMIKTPLPDIGLAIDPVPYDPITKQIGTLSAVNYYMIGMIGSKNLITMCQKFAGLNFGGQAVAFMTQDLTSGQMNLVDIDKPFKDRIDLCQKLQAGNSFGVLFK